MTMAALREFQLPSKVPSCGTPTSTLGGGFSARTISTEAASVCTSEQLSERIGPWSPPSGGVLAAAVEASKCGDAESTCAAISADASCDSEERSSKHARDREFDALDALLAECDCDAETPVLRTPITQAGLPTTFDEAGFVVRNTFIDTPVNRPSSLDEFLKEREAQSCPATRDHTVEDDDVILARIDEMVESAWECDPTIVIAAQTEQQVLRPSLPTLDTGKEDTVCMGTAATFSQRDLAGGQPLQLPVGDSGIECCSMWDVGLCQDEASAVAFDPRYTAAVGHNSGGYAARVQHMDPCTTSSQLMPGCGVFAQPGSICTAPQLPFMCEASAAGPFLQATAIAVGMSGGWGATACTSALTTHTEWNSPMASLEFSPNHIFDQGPQIRVADIPTSGSALHGSGTCKPCGFVYSRGCAQGTQCAFCHLCAPGEKKRRNRQKKRLEARCLDAVNTAP